MILTLPDTLSGIARVTFDIERIDYAAPQARGRQGGVQAGFPLWAARLEIDRSDPVSADMWRAFKDRLRGRIRRFYCWDTARPFPIDYRFGFSGLVRAGTSTAFDGSATSWSQAIDADGDAALTLNGLPAGLTLQRCDYIGLKWDAEGADAGTYERRTLARVSEPATANASGVAVVTVEPPIDTNLVPSGAIAHLDNPRCVMQLVPEETELGPISGPGVLGGGAIVAIQDLRA